jgi:hypothetical protein
LREEGDPARRESGGHLAANVRCEAGAAVQAKDDADGQVDQPRAIALSEVEGNASGPPDRRPHGTSGRAALGQRGGEASEREGFVAQARAREAQRAVSEVP